jgi:hypothetical protein
MTNPELWFPIGMSCSPQVQLCKRKMYRIIAGFLLVLTLAGFPSGSPAQEVVSRLEFCEKLLSASVKQPVNEVFIMQSGILDPQPDGKFHLDWPISRGDAARVCLGIMSGFPGARPLPGFFADTPLSSPFYSVLAKVGGAFAPLPQDRFGPDVLLTPEDANHVTRVFSRHLPSDSLWVSPLGTAPASEEQIGSDPAVWGKNFPMGFRFPGAVEPDVTGSSASAAARISRLATLVPPEQLSPHYAFNLRQAVNGMDEMENVLDSLELSILDLVHSQAENPTQKSQLSDGLQQFRDIIGPLLEKLRFSREEVRSALLTDSESIGLADTLQRRISEGQRRLNRLMELIDDRRKRL